jgi:hypothetical protein
MTIARNQTREINPLKCNHNPADLKLKSFVLQRTIERLVWSYLKSGQEKAGAVAVEK